MTVPIWNPEWLESSVRRVREPEVWRGVETQHLSATTLLVDRQDEHDVLEQLLEDSKPALPATVKKHFLLITPFRYAPLHASRFRRAGESGLWYGAGTLEAACAEVAHWRRRFIADSAGLANEKIVSNHTFFAALVDGHGIDLMQAPWLACRPLWTSDDYTHTHALAGAANAAGMELIRYESVRAPGHACVAVLVPDALHEPDGGLDRTRQTWSCTATREHVMMMSELDRSLRFEFGR